MQQSPKRERPPVPDWFLPAGCIALLAMAGGVLLGAAAAFVGDVQGWDAILAFLLVTALNPLFFAGLPLSMYWLERYGKHNPLPSIVPNGSGIVGLLIVAAVIIGAVLANK